MLCGQVWDDCHCSNGPGLLPFALVRTCFVSPSGARWLSLLESPDFNVLHEEILLFREHGVPECLTGVTPAVVKVSVQPQAELTAEEANKR